jgi:hypothetical protein
MRTDLITIDSILLEHTAIKYCIEALRTAVAEQATFLFESENNWDNTHLKQLKDNHIRLVESVQAFHDKLERHCFHEEKDLLPMLGKLVADVNVIEHQEIMNQIERAHNLLNEAKLLGDLKPYELMAETYNVERTVEKVCRVVESHEANETNLFAQMRTGLQADQEEHL